MAASEKILLSAPCAFNLAEASRLVEIAMALEHHPKARGAFAVHLISDGGDFGTLIERHGFALTRMEPRLTKEKIEHIAKVDRGETFAPACYPTQSSDADRHLKFLTAIGMSGSRFEADRQRGSAQSEIAD